MFRFLFIGLFLFTLLDVYAQQKVLRETSMGYIHGVYDTPKKKARVAALIIAGSGPTDRNGNNPSMQNNSLKFLAEGLNKNGIATLRYDKKGVGESKGVLKDEADFRFGHYVEDAARMLDWLKGKRKIKKVVVIGHSEGSLVGMLAVYNMKADAFVSLAGVGSSADIILKEQMGGSPITKKYAFPVIDSLKAGKLYPDSDPMLNSVFRQSVQPYLISWFKYDASEEIGKLSVPSLIIQGDKDLQVSVDHAEMLSKSLNPAVQLKQVQNPVIIKDMSHVLKYVEGDSQNAIVRTYNQPDVGIMEEVIQQITGFIKAL